MLLLTLNTTLKLNRQTTLGPNLDRRMKWDRMELLHKSGITIRSNLTNILRSKLGLEELFFRMFHISHFLILVAIKFIDETFLKK